MLMVALFDFPVVELLLVLVLTLSLYPVLADIDSLFEADKPLELDVLPAMDAETFLADIAADASCVESCADARNDACVVSDFNWAIFIFIALDCNAAFA